MDGVKRLMVYCPHGHDLEEDDFPDVGRYVLFDDHAAAVARLEARLSRAEKVVEAAEAMRNEPHIYDVEMDRYVKCIEHDRCDLCKPFDAALAAYRSAK